MIDSACVCEDSVRVPLHLYSFYHCRDMDSKVN